MDKKYKVGEGYFLPVKITSTDYDREFPVQFSYFDGQDPYTECVQDGALLTAEEIVKASNLPAVLIEEGLTTRITELEAKNATLTAELEEEKANTYGWTNTAEERGRLISSLRESLNKASGENDELITKNNELEDANRSLTKACSEWQTAAQAHFKTTEKLREENKKLKQQLADANELLSDAQAKVKELTETDCMRVQEFKPIIEERDRLKGELEQEKKRTQVWKDSSEEHRQRAEELEGDVRRYEQDISEVEVTVQKLTKENDSLKADILELKAQINAFGPRSSEVEELKKEKKAVEDELEYRRSDIVVLNGKLKTANKENGRMAKRVFHYEADSKQKDLIISMLAARVLELEKGGEQ